MKVQAQVKVNFQAYSRTVKRQVRPIIERDLLDVKEIIVEESNAPKSGRIYRRPTGGDYQASAPGQPPAIRSGDLLRSISAPTFPAPNIGQMRITAPYAGGLERGTGRVAARPFVHPAILRLIQRRNGGRL